MPKRQYEKPHTTISQQIEKLKNRGLCFHDEEYAYKVLTDISYYRLSGYFYHFQDENDNFVDGIYFEEVVKLYGFDSKLRLLMLDGLGTVEISLRSITGNVLGEIDPFAFDNLDIFNDKKDRKVVFQNSRDKNWERAKENFADHFKEEYQCPPTWVEIETWTMGTLRDLFVCLKEQHRINIVKRTNIKTTSLLLGWIRNLTNLRNICAHHGRLWNRSLNNIDASNRGLGELHALFNNTKNAQLDSINQNPNNRLYFYCMIIWYLLQGMNPDSRWNKRLYDLINEEFPSMPSVGLINMGFPDDWHKNSFWKL